MSAALVLLGLPCHSFAEPVPGEVLVGFRDEVGVAATGTQFTDARTAAQASQAAARLERSLNAVGNTLEAVPALNVRRIKVHPGVSVQQAIATLRQLPEVAYAEPNNIVREFSTPSDPAMSGGTQYARLWRCARS